MIANAVTGSTGHGLLMGMDMTGHGLQIDPNYKNEAIHRREANPNTWRSMHIFDLIGSTTTGLDLIGRYLTDKGYSTTSVLQYNREGEVHFIVMDSKEFRVKGSKITEKKL